MTKSNNFNPKKKSVLFCLYDLTGGGAEKLLLDILRRIDTKSIDVDLCILSKGGVYDNDLPDYVNCYVYNDLLSFPPKQYDVEIAFLQGKPTKLVALHQSKAVKIAWVHTDMYASRTSASSFKSYNEEVMCYNMFDYIVFVSQTSMQQFEKLFPQITTNKTVIYNLINKEEIISRSQASVCPAKKTKLTMCTVGRLEPVKGIGRLVNVMSKLKKEGMDFRHLIIGDGQKKNEIQNLIEQHDLKDTVFLLGFQKNPYPYMKESDIFISASYLEGLPIVVGEALCLGKPIVATNVSGTAEILGNGEYGMLVESNEDSIYEGLKMMMVSDTLRSEYSRRAETGSLTDIFDIKKTIGQINDLLHKQSLQKQF